MNLKSLFRLFIMTIAMLPILTSCLDEEDAFSDSEQFAIDLEIIQDYVSENLPYAYQIFTLDYLGDVYYTGVFVDIFHHGSEDPFHHPALDSADVNTVQYVTVGFKGYLTDGTVFDETEEDELISYPLDGFIDGWKLAIPEMTKGDSATIVIPSFYGYKNSEVGSIPKNSVLIFDVYLESFERL